MDELTKSLREIESTIARKQAELQELVGEPYLRGDDLKQYVNMLKAKSSVYKKQRAELSALEVSFWATKWNVYGKMMCTDKINWAPPFGVRSIMYFKCFPN